MSEESVIDKSPIVLLIDKAISHCSGRDIVSSLEMTDFLLDMRIIALQEKEPA